MQTPRLTPAHVRQVMADIDELERNPTVGCPPPQSDDPDDVRAVTAAAHRAARLGAPLWTEDDMFLLERRVERMCALTFRTAVEASTSGRQCAAAESMLKAFALQRALVIGQTPTSPTWPRDLGPLRVVDDPLYDADPADVLALRADGASLDNIAKRFRMSGQQIDYLVRFELRRRIDTVAGDYRRRSFDELEAAQIPMWGALSTSRGVDLAVVGALTRVLRLECEVLGALLIPPTPGSRRVF